MSEASNGSGRTIEAIRAREVLDCRGLPTVQVDVELEGRLGEDGPVGGQLRLGGQAAPRHPVAHAAPAVIGHPSSTGARGGRRPGCDIGRPRHQVRARCP